MRRARRRRCRSGPAGGDRLTGPTPSAAGQSQPVQRVGWRRVGGSCFLTNARLGAGEQAADVGVVADEHQHGDCQRKLNDGRDQPATAASTGASAKEASAAREDMRGQPPWPARSRRRPARPARRRRSARHRTVATPLPPLKRSQTGKHVAEHRAEAGPQRRLGSAEPGREQHGGGALRPSSSSVAAARPLLPVRSTLVAPMLPEPMRGCRPGRRPGSAADRTGSSRADSPGGRRRRGAWRP